MENSLLSRMITVMTAACALVMSIASITMAYAEKDKVDALQNFQLVVMKEQQKEDKTQILDMRKDVKDQFVELKTDFRQQIGDVRTQINNLSDKIDRNHRPANNK